MKQAAEIVNLQTINGEAMETKPHEGRNVKRIREILGVKQETLAIDLGLSQQAISSLEQRETLDMPTLEKIAKTLGVSPEAIKNFSEESTINYFNTFNDNSVNQGVNQGSVEATHYQCTFNPLDKIIELYESLLKAERGRITLLEEKVVLLQNLTPAGE
jgi:transcriptional regulator with XRE-family HTH domain